MSNIVFQTEELNPFVTATTERLVTVTQDVSPLTLFTVTYGLQVKPGLSYAEAAKELGECLLHAANCDGLIDAKGE